MSTTAKELFARAVREKIKNRELPFFHLAPEGANIESEGLISPDYALNEKDDPELFKSMTDKYRERLVNVWGIYPDRDPASLTNEEILSGLRRVRGNDGANKIYFFRYLPDKSLGPNMADSLIGKTAYSLDLENPKVRKIIHKIDWGKEGSKPTGKRRNKKYYEKVSPEEYFANYDDKGTPLFASLDHIAVEPEDGRIPPELLTKV